MWVEPIFTPSVNFSNFLSAVSDMISHVHCTILEQSFHPHKGRPRLSISEAALSAFLEQNFTQVEIAKMLCVYCTNTVHRRIIEL